MLLVALHTTVSRPHRLHALPKQQAITDIVLAAAAAAAAAAAPAALGANGPCCLATKQAAAGPMQLTAQPSTTAMARFMAALLAAALAAAALCAPPVAARFVIEEGGLRVVLPDEAKKQYPMGFDMALANFGELDFPPPCAGQPSDGTWVLQVRRCCAVCGAGLLPEPDLRTWHYLHAKRTWHRAHAKGTACWLAVSPLQPHRDAQCSIFCRPPDGVAGTRLCNSKPKLHCALQARHGTAARCAAA